MPLNEKRHWLEQLIPSFHHVAEEMRALQQKEVEIIEQVRALESEKDQLIEQHDTLRKSNEELRERLKEQEKIKEQLAAQVARRDRIQERLQSQLEEFAKDKQVLREQVERRDGIQQELQRQVRKQHEVIEKLTKTVERLKVERDEVYSQYNRLLASTDETTPVSEPFNAGKTREDLSGRMAENDGWRLNMGCGLVKKPGFLNVDVDASVRPDLIVSLDEPLPFGSDVFELIETHHVIEHVYPWTIVGILREFWRVLRPGGKLAIECPSVESACSWLARTGDFGLNSQMGMWAIYGDPNQKNPLQMHKWGYTPITLRQILKEAGFVRIQREVPETHVAARDFRMTAMKLGTALPQNP